MPPPAALRGPQGTVSGFPRPNLELVAPPVPSDAFPSGAPATPPPGPAVRTATILGVGSRMPVPLQTPRALSRADIQPPTFTRRPESSSPPPATASEPPHAPKPSTLRPPAPPDTEHVTVIRLPGPAGARFSQPPPRRPTPRPEAEDAPRAVERPPSDPAFGRPASDPAFARPTSDPAPARPPSDPAFGRPPSDPATAAPSSDPSPPYSAHGTTDTGGSAARPPSSSPPAGGHHPSDRPEGTGRHVTGGASAGASAGGAPDPSLTPKLAGWKERRQRQLGASPPPPSPQSAADSGERPVSDRPEAAAAAVEPTGEAPPREERRRTSRRAMGHPSGRRLAVYVTVFLVVMTGATVGITYLLL